MTPIYTGQSVPGSWWILAAAILFLFAIQPVTADDDNNGAGEEEEEHFYKPITNEITEEAMTFTIHIELCPHDLRNDDDEVTLEQLNEFIRDKKPAAEAIWNNQNHSFKGPDGVRRKVRINIDMTAIDDCDKEKKPDKWRMSVKPGAPPSNSRFNAKSVQLFLENNARTLAHEVGHVFGLDEEYNNTNPSRSNDNLMGSEGVSNNRRIMRYHFSRLVFLCMGEVSEEVHLRRKKAWTYYRVVGRQTAKDIADGNGYKPADIDDMAGFFDANNAEPQRPPPPLQDSE